MQNIIGPYNNCPQFIDPVFSKMNKFKFNKVNMFSDIFHLSEKEITLWKF